MPQFSLFYCFPTLLCRQDEALVDEMPRLSILGLVFWCKKQQQKELVERHEHKHDIRSSTELLLLLLLPLPPPPHAWILEAEDSQQRKHRRSPGSRLNTDTTTATTLIAGLFPPYIVCHLLVTGGTASFAFLSVPFFSFFTGKKDHKISEIKWNGCLGMDMSLATWSGTWGNRRISCSFAEDCCCRGYFFFHLPQTPAIYAGSPAVKTHISVFWCLLARSLLMRRPDEWASRELRVIMAVKNN